MARRWLMLCLVRRKDDHSPEEPNEFELNSIRNDPDKLDSIRSRLSDVAWWMRLLCQNIGTRANREDLEVGKFFQGRYRALRILDEETLLACAAYVDLNPIRVAMAETLESSEYTSVQRRIQALQGTNADSIHGPFNDRREERFHWGLCESYSRTLQQQRIPVDAESGLFGVVRRQRQTSPCGHDRP